LGLAYNQGDGTTDAANDGAANDGAATPATPQKRATFSFSFLFLSPFHLFQ
jgi:hypothetical protein